MMTMPSNFQPNESYFKHWFAFITFHDIYGQQYERDIKIVNAIQLTINWTRFTTIFDLISIDSDSDQKSFVSKQSLDFLLNHSILPTNQWTEYQRNILCFHWRNQIKEKIWVQFNTYFENRISLFIIKNSFSYELYNFVFLIPKYWTKLNK